MAHTYNSSYMGGEGRRMEIQGFANLSKSKTPYLRNKLKQERTRGVTQVVEGLPSKCKALSANPSYHQKRKK
jgi:hypothetical protein